MITLKPEKKPDYRFVAISAAALALLCIFSLFSGDKDIQVSELGDDYNPSFSKLVISEVVSSNPGVYINEYNETSDYIELYNGSDHVINLNGYGLSDKEDKIKWRFPDVSIEPDSYLLVSLAGHDGDGLCAPFKLSSKGSERLILANAKSKIIDGVDTLPLAKGQAMVRDEKGNWTITETLTPGYENSLNGYRLYLESLEECNNDQLVINEFLTSNNGNYLSDNGSDGFIEIANISDEPVNLDQYYLSNDSDRPYRYRLSGILDPGAVLSLDLDGSLFDLRSSNGEVLLSKHEKIVSHIAYSNLAKGIAYVYEDGNYYLSPVVSPGYPNTIDGIDLFQTEHRAPGNDLVISEIMNSNDTYLPQNGARYYDWIEVYNNSDEEIRLSDYSINTDRKSDKRYSLPDVVLNPGNYYILMCSGDSSLSNEAYSHLGFRLSDNEAVYLYHNNEMTDCALASGIPSGYSFGRFEDKGFFYMDQPTPGLPNRMGTRTITQTPTVSITGGIYDSSVSVELQGRGIIYYTLDGSDPSVYSNVYNGESILIEETSVLKVRSYSEGERISEPAINTYIISENHTMPVLSISPDSKDFSQLNANAWVMGLKKQCYMELFENGERIASPCSISLFGGNARSQSKKAYCLRFDSEWGAKDLYYKLFPNRDNSVYDSFVLRSGSSDWTSAIIRDIVGTSLVDDFSDIDVQAYKPVICYVNGNYWGIYNLREKVNSHFIEEHHNVSKDSISIFRIDGEVECGSKKEYDELRAFCRTHDLSNEENYQYVKEKINVENTADYWIAEGFFANNDLLNVRLFSSDEYDNGRFNYIFYDLDFAWYNPSVNWYTDYIGRAGGMTNHNYENDIIRALLRNGEFRNLWLERLSYHLNNTFKADTVIRRIDEICAVYEPEIERNQKRWGLSADTWRREVDELRKYVRVRGSYYLAHTKSYFGLSETQMKEIFGDIYE